MRSSLARPATTPSSNEEGEPAVIVSGRPDYIAMDPHGGGLAGGVLPQEEDLRRHTSTAAAASAADNHRQLQQGLSALSPQEFFQLQQILAKTTQYRSSPLGGGAASDDASDAKLTHASTNSDYPHFKESTHAWAIFADDPHKRAGKTERFVGTLIIAFQLLAYYIFASEAIDDYQEGRVPVLIDHPTCVADGYMPAERDLECVAEYTNSFDAFVAYCMLAIFLASDFIQAGRAMVTAAASRQLAPLFFAHLAGIEVICAYLSACIAVSYNLYMGEVTDAVEVGVGLLFIRELSSRTYQGIRSGEVKQYRTFFSLLVVLIVLGMFVLDPLAQFWFARPASPMYEEQENDQYE